MKIRNILAAIAMMAGATGMQAQEYLNYSGSRVNGYFLLDEIDSVTIGPITSDITYQLARDNQVTIYHEALQITGIDTLINNTGYDANYDVSLYSRYFYTADFWREVATAPDYKIKSYTLFVTPDAVLKTKYGIRSLEDLAAKAKSIYDETYPEDAGLYDTDYTHPKNPLNRFVRYTVMKCDVKDLNRLTGLILQKGVVDGVLGVETSLTNPTDWYQTLLPNTLMKCEQLTMMAYVGNGIQKDFYINRRYDANYAFEGTHISRTLPVMETECYNGHYYYVDDLVVYTRDVRDVVQDTRIRMDFSTVFPELTTLSIRQNGDPTQDGNSDAPDLTFKNGRNFYFPKSYLDGVTIRDNTTILYRRPHWNFWCYQGDEFLLTGNYDIEFKLPPVPYAGEWQVRLGFCALPSRGKALIYLDGAQQGDTIDFRLYLNDRSISGEGWKLNDDYNSMSEEQKVTEQKLLREKGFYRAPRSIYHTDGNVKNDFVNNPRTYRRVLCQAYMDNTQEHTIRIQNVDAPTNGNNNEMQLDYIELVPKSVYDVPEGEMEDDL